MRRPKHAMAGANAPGMDKREGTSGKERLDPPHASAIATPVFLSDADAERLRARVLALVALCNELGIFLATITLHQVSEPTAFQAFPEGQAARHELPSRVFKTWNADIGRHQVRLFTGNSVIDEINAETTV